jgi:hypothetical protein
MRIKGCRGVTIVTLTAFGVAVVIDERAHPHPVETQHIVHMENVHWAVSGAYARPT